MDTNTDCLSEDSRLSSSRPLRWHKKVITLSTDELCRLCVFSFDYIQPRQGDQRRKTRFFRRLYGRTQSASRRLRDGRIASYSYRYPGVLAELPHVRLGKSVFGVRPGTEGPVLELFESFEEVAFYRFVAWLPARMWQPINKKPLLAASSLIARFGHLSVLLATARRGGLVTLTELIDSGFDGDYVAVASRYLQDHGFLDSTQEGFSCTPRGRTLAHVILSLVSGSEPV